MSEDWPEGVPQRIFRADTWRDGLEASQIHALERLEIYWLTLVESVIFHFTNPWEFDGALIAAGWDMGPCEVQDLIGLDRLRDLRGAGNPAFIVSNRMVAEGRLGKKVSVGWYRYPGGGGKVDDPLMEDMILEEIYFAKAKRGQATGRELAEAIIGAVQAYCHHHSLTDIPAAFTEQRLGVADLPKSARDIPPQIAEVLKRAGLLFP